MNLSPRPHLQPSARGPSGFNLLEVMIATALFFVVAFAVLALVSRALRLAAALDHPRPPIGAIASDFMIRTPLEFQRYNGDFDDLYEEYQWDAEVFPAEEMIEGMTTNEILKVIELSVTRSGRRESDQTLTILKFEPAQPRREQRGAFVE